MRLQGLTIYSQYFRFVLEDNKAIDNKAIIENTPSPYGPVISSVTYDNERQTVACTCSNDVPCEHKVFIHEMIDKERDDALFRFLEDCREKSAQTITRGTINRLRGAFAREYNLAKGVVQYPARREPLGWEGKVPSSLIPMRVIQKSFDTYMVYEIASDVWRLVAGTDDPLCKGGKCRRGCKHEEAVKEAVRTWRENGMMPRAQSPLTMVEKAEPVSITGKAEGGWITIPPGFTGTFTIGMSGLDELAKTARDQLAKTARERMEKAAREEVITAFQRVIFDAPSVNSTASEYSVGIDPAKIREDIDKAKKLLEKKEEPKPEKPAKPRTRFTDLEL